MQAYQMFKSHHTHPIYCKSFAAVTDCVNYCRIAGSDSSSTAMSTVFYYLLKEPDVMRQLQGEIRSSFKLYDEITALSTTDLPFLVAVIREAMRIYPPLALALPRIVPHSGDTIDGHFVPAGVIFAHP
jgi:cytochrome P450